MEHSKGFDLEYTISEKINGLKTLIDLYAKIKQSNAKTIAINVGSKGQNSQIFPKMFENSSTHTEVYNIDPCFNDIEKRVKKITLANYCKDKKVTVWTARAHFQNGLHKKPSDVCKKNHAYKLLNKSEMLNLNSILEQLDILHKKACNEFKSTCKAILAQNKKLILIQFTSPYILSEYIDIACDEIDKLGHKLAIVGGYFITYPAISYSYNAITKAQKIIKNNSVNIDRNLWEESSKQNFDRYNDYEYGKVKRSFDDLTLTDCFNNKKVSPIIFITLTIISSISGVIIGICKFFNKQLTQYLAIGLSLLSIFFLACTINTYSKSKQKNKARQEKSHSPPLIRDNTQQLLVPTNKPTKVPGS